ncbi:ATP phosphoribosyltransferase regulatory subunit [Metabacillus rhizolycopersici]|jgi:ATP phosphoribosyltransferase regulatory subunit|uniref:ATP phosphoribosyltransferase regulatory subunit n=1 Tax=Metabacillus rhizolycopersici TaxID=2875709 RepID=A0ABS7USB2_9BACI|nr:ATP phosphoribosyltransferase regulatory subunit [Metabacillus rhizolycopersici]MBZ5750944.1 ATP phosphoribosyltransferase regulatory subunit [Metabacillus rhizolycopersici]
MFMFEKPLGMVDTLPNLYEVKKKTRHAMTNVIEQWGFQFIETPTLEYYETVGVQSAILDQQLFKLLDAQGHTLVLRPEMTAPIARVAASKLYNDLYPLRLAYSANVFRAQQREGGRPAEFEQVGVELIGDGTTSADAEVIALMVATLKEAGLENFKIAIGHIGYANALFKEVLGSQERVDVLRRFLYEKNYVGYKEHVKSLPLSSIDKERLFTLLKLRGDIDKVGEAQDIVTSSQARDSLEEISQLWSILEELQVTDYLQLDLNIVSHMSYYTGILFEVHADNVGFLIGSGGRYDHLFEKFNRAAPATGFGLRIDRLIEALKMTDEQKLECVIYSQERRLEAIAHATKLRASNKRVVMQDISGIKDVDVFTKHFEEVVYFIGSRKGEL